MWRQFDEGTCAWLQPAPGRNCWTMESRWSAKSEGGERRRGRSGEAATEDIHAKGNGETKTPGGSWAMFKASRCSVAAMPKQQLGLPSEPVWRSHVSCWTLQPQPGVGWSVVWCWHGFLLASAVATWGTWCCHGVLLSSPAAASWVWCWPGVLLSSGAVSLEVLGAGAGLQAAIGIGACYNCYVCYVTFESGIRWPRRSLPGSARHSRHVTRSCSFWAL